MGDVSDYLRGVPKPSEILDPKTAAAAATVLAQTLGQTLDPDVKTAVIAAQQAAIDQLNEWITLARFAERLSIGLAIGSGLLTLFVVSAMTWNDLFAGSGLWEFSLLLFALAVFVASPLAIFVIGRPLKGVDEWSPGLPTK